jgi:hypothetical protein
MAALSAKQRRSLPASEFAYPATRSFPIDTPARARAALARAGQSKTKGSYRHVAEKVRAKWGDRVATVGPTNGTVTGPGLRKGSASKTRRKR